MARDSDIRAAQAFLQACVGVSDTVEGMAVLTPV